MDTRVPEHLTHKLKQQIPSIFFISVVFNCTSSLLQFNVDATDLGVPPRKADRAAAVSIRVRRNKETPSFSNLPATIKLEMNTDPRTQVGAQYCCQILKEQ